jgi:hypothetical protein
MALDAGDQRSAARYRLERLEVEPRALEERLQRVGTPVLMTGAGSAVVDAGVTNQMLEELDYFAICISVHRGHATC